MSGSALVLGIDPGLDRLGYGLVCREGSRVRAVDYGLVTTPRLAPPARLAALARAVRDLLERYEPSAVATEKLLFARNRTTALTVSQALGVVLSEVGAFRAEWAEYSPSEVKLAVVGYGGATKRQVAYVVRRLLGLEGVLKTDDVSDALAIALCHALRGPLGQALFQSKSKSS